MTDRRRIDETVPTLSLLQGGGTFATKLSELYYAENFFNHIDRFANDVASTKVPVKLLRDNFKDLISDNKICQETGNILSSCECISTEQVKDILSDLHRAKADMASNIILWGSVISAAMLYVQINELRKIWARVKQAKNIVGECGCMNEINYNMTLLTNWASEIQIDIMDYENFRGSSEDKKQLMDNIRDRLAEVNITYTDTKVMIGQLSARVNGEIKILDGYQGEQVSSGILNSVHGITSAIQLYQLSGLLGAGLTALQGAITAGFFGLAAANVAMYHVTGDVLDEIRKTFQNINELDEQIRSIGLKIVNASAWVRRNRV